MHPRSFHNDRVFYLTLSVEALWIARVLHDALDVALESQGSHDAADADRLKALCLTRDVFERLGQYGCSPERVSPWSNTWSAASRVELIRQVAVHWRSFIDTSFGTAVGAHLIRALTDDEVLLLEQIQRFSSNLQLNHSAISHCMQQQMDVMSMRLESQRALRQARYLGARC